MIKMREQSEFQTVKWNGKDVDIPKDWEVKNIKNEISFKMGATPKKENDNYKGNLPWITISNLKNKEIKEHTALIKKDKNTKIFPAGSLLISFKMSVGKAGFLLENSAINEAIICITESGTKHSLNYLYYNLPNLFKRNALPNGQGLPLLNQEGINKIEFLTPCKEEQEKISEILSLQEKKIEHINKLIELYEKRLRYTSNELLSGRLRIKEVDGETVFYKNEKWKTVKVNDKDVEIPEDWNIDYFTKLGNLFTGKREKYTATEDEILNKNYILSIGGEHLGDKSFTLKNKIYTNEKSYLKQKNAQICIGDLLIIKDGATTGHNIYVDFLPHPKMILNEHVYRFKAHNSQQSKFVYFLFNSYHVKKCLNSLIYGMIPSLNQKNFNSLEVILPCELNEKKLISDTLSQQEELIQEQKELLELEKKRFTWLLENLLSGKYTVEESDDEILGNISLTDNSENVN